jgi:dienelactone hydrolase
MRCFAMRLGVLSMLLVAPLLASAETVQTDVAIQSPDGVMLRGTFSSTGTPAPGVVLFHQCNMDRHAWDGLARDLVSAGLQVLTFDSRGYGQSGRGRPMPQNIAGDGDAVYSWLAAQHSVTRIAVGGASCGVAQAVNLAMRHRDIKALVLLSGGASVRGIKFIGEMPNLPVFAAASERDATGMSVAEVGRASKAPQSALKLYGGSAHGVDMFRPNADLKPLIVRWLKDRLTQ